MNPFKFGDPVEGEYYLERSELDKAVMQFISNRIHVVLIGPRRFGKTSFVYHLNRKMEEQGFVVLFVDIFNITSHRDFLQQLLRALKVKKSWVQAGMEWLSDHRPKLSADIDPVSGQTSFGLSLSNAEEKDVKEMIQDVLSGIKELGKQVLLVIDEFQKIADLNDEGWLEATLRTHMQQLRNTSFLFTGSRKGIISDMLNNPARPLYRSCQLIEFPSFGDELVSWIVERFKLANVHADPEAIRSLKKTVQETPNYVQMICFHLIAAGVKNVTQASVEETLKNVVLKNTYAYQTLLKTLTPLQQRVLRLAAIKQSQIFSKHYLSEFEIPNAPALSSSIKALKSKGILDEEGTEKGHVIFDDPLFAIWLRITFDEDAHV